MKNFVFLVLFFVLSGCAGSPMERNANGKSVDDFLTMKEDSLCHSFLDNNPYAIEARSRRKLGDCTESYRECRGYGLNPDDPMFVQCRMQHDAIEKLSKHRNTYVPPKPSTDSYITNTYCDKSYGGNSVSCQSF